MVAAWLIWLSLAFGGNCERATTVFSEYSIAVTIEKLGPWDGTVFSAIIRGFNYDAIEKHFHLNRGELERILNRGLDILWEMKKNGL